jgi:hypothetical protein
VAADGSEYTSSKKFQVLAISATVQLRLSKGRQTMQYPRDVPKEEQLNHPNSVAKRRSGHEHRVLKSLAMFHSHELLAELVTLAWVTSVPLQRRFLLPEALASLRLPLCDRCYRMRWV